MVVYGMEIQKAVSINSGSDSGARLGTGFLIVVKPLFSINIKWVNKDPKGHEL